MQGEFWRRHDDAGRIGDTPRFGGTNGYTKTEKAKGLRSLNVIERSDVIRQVNSLRGKEKTMVWTRVMWSGLKESSYN
jgi:hypothetical protein